MYMDALHESHEQLRGTSSLSVDKEHLPSMISNMSEINLCQMGEQTPNEGKHQTSIASNNNKFQFPKLKHYKWWQRVTTYTLMVLVGQTAATLLGQLYYDKGGNSKWMATFVQTAGFPMLIPMLFFFRKDTTSSPSNEPSSFKLTIIYFLLGLIIAGDDLMYSYGLLFLPVSTYSLLCATQLAFNAVFAYFINAHKFTALVLNSLVLLTISACLLAFNANNDDTTSISASKGKYAVGFLCTIGASATYALYLSLVQLSFEKVIKQETFTTVLNMQIYPSFVATAACVVGLFASGEWKSLRKEMRTYMNGSVSYIMTLVWISITWQISSLGLLGLVFEASSLFSNVISTLALPLIPIFAVVFFHDKMNGVKAMALVLAMWGFLSYIYQHYLDDTRETRQVVKEKSGIEIPSAATEIC